MKTYFWKFIFCLFLVIFLAQCSYQEKGKQANYPQQEGGEVATKNRRESEKKEMPLNAPKMADQEAISEEQIASPEPKPSSDDKPKDKDIDSNTEDYDKIVDNPFLSPQKNPLSTFSIDVDAASYTNTRRYLTGGSLPPKGAVRIEEFINFFDYDYPQPADNQPFSVTTEVASCPWNAENKLVHIGLQGKKLNYSELKPSNLVFLIDVSGSMEDENKLPLLRKSLKILLEQLNERDKIAIVVYAGSSGLVLPSTPASEKNKIMKTLDNLQAGGSTAGGEGIELAYKVAVQNLIKDGNNRVILATDGDFNVGVSNTSSLVELIEEKRKTGVFLTILGFGMGNYKDNRMESISNAGNGNYYYIDSQDEAERIFEKEMRATLFTIAKDVKIQVEFNPAKVQAYRLIGYENRKLNDEDFNDDTKDAGELGAGHTVTALYEIIPVGVKSSFVKSVDNLKYQQVTDSKAANSDELMTVKLRYKRPKEDISNLLSTEIKNSNLTWDKSSANFRFSASVAGFGMLLRESPYHNNYSYEQILNLGKSAQNADKYRSEFLELVDKAQKLTRNK